MAAQPIYPDQLNQALDRLFLRMTTFNNGQTDTIMTQMRVDKQESIARDEALLKRVEILENGLRSLADSVLKLATKVSDLETGQQTLETGQHTLMQLMRDLHAEAMEAINDLRRQQGSE